MHPFWTVNFLISPWVSATKAIFSVLTVSSFSQVEFPTNIHIKVEKKSFFKYNLSSKGKVSRVQIDKLSSFNKRFFKKIFGLQIKRRREELGYSLEYVAELLGLTSRTFKMIEAGQKNISQHDFEALVDTFNLDSTELLEMSRITHVQYLMSLYKEIDENFPN